MIPIVVFLPERNPGRLQMCLAELSLVWTDAKYRRTPVATSCLAAGFRFPSDYTPKPQMLEVGERTDRSPSPAARKAAAAAQDDESGEVLAAEAETGLFDEDKAEPASGRKHLLSGTSADPETDSEAAYREATYSTRSRQSGEL